MLQPIRNFFKAQQKPVRMNVMPTSFLMSMDGTVTPIKSTGTRSPLFNWFHGIDDGMLLGDNPRSYARAYYSSVLMWRCVNVIADTFAALKLLYTDSQDNPLPPNHPFVAALETRGARLKRTTAKDYQIWGVGYWLPYPRQARYQRLNPQTVEPITDMYGGLEYFRHTVMGARIADFTPDELIYFWDYDPDDDFGSISPTRLALRSIGIEIALDLFVKKFFENDATPGGVLSTDQRLLDPDAEMYAARWDKRHKGVEKSNSTAVMGSGLTYTPITPRLKDLVVDQIGESSSRAICQAYGVPMTIALATDAANFATMKEQHQMFYMETVLPFASKILEEVNLQAAPFFGGNCKVAVDESAIDVLQEDKTEVSQRAQIGFQSGFRSLNEARQLEDLPPLESGDVYLINGQLLPATLQKEGGDDRSSQVYAQNAMYTSGVASINEVRQLHNLPPLPVDVFALPGGMGLVTRQQLEQGQLPATVMQPTGSPQLPFGDGSMSLDSEKSIGQSFCLLFHIGADPDLVALQNQLKGKFEDVKWNDPQGFHVTLVYCPTATEEQIAQVKEGLANLDIPQPALKIGSLRSFDNLGEHALHFRLQRNSDLLTFQHELYQLCTDAGLEMSAYSKPESYIPHITMGYSPTPQSTTFHAKLTVLPRSLQASLEVAKDDYETVFEQACGQVPMVIEAPAKHIVVNKISSDLSDWRRKALKSGKTAFFRSDHIPSALADFVRMDLAVCDGTREAIKAIFEDARAAVKQADGDEELATPEEFEKYWRGIGNLYNSIARTFQAGFNELPQRLANRVRRDGESADLNALLDEYAQEQLEVLVGTADAPGELVKIFLAGAARGNDLLNDSRLTANPNKAVNIAWDVVNTAAVDWARNYAAELVRGITDTTKDIYRQNIAAWIESGQPLTELAKAIEGDLKDLTIPEHWSVDKVKWATSPERAALIAMTESTNAYNVGVTTRWKQAGVEQIKWRNQADSHVCPTCRALNNKVGGIQHGIELGGRNYLPPAHPNCRCFTSPVL